VQSHNRDTCKFAFKCCSINIDGEWHDVYKEPFHDAFKKSKKGRLGLFVDENNKFETKAMISKEDEEKNVLQTVFENGELLFEQSFADIRERAKL
ncbi:MAG: nicotinate phosphoribosyltransferase, partial [Nanoarchaeota archaeon]